MDQGPDPPTERPDFGPSGYLPERASKRARKIVLRSPLGLQWVIAAVVAGLVVVIAGVLFLQRSGDPPPDPWTPVGEVADLEPSQVDPDLDVLLVGTGGRVRAFSEATDVAYCPETNRLEATDGRVWSLTGRGFGGAASLDEHPTVVHEGVAYVDPTRTSAGPRPSDDDAEPGCG